MALIAEETVVETEEDELDKITVKNTIKCMLETPYPVEYLKVLLENKIIDRSIAYRTALGYVEMTNRFRTFVDMTLYDIEPFKRLSFDDLLSYIQFICNNGLNVSRGRTLCASIL